MKEGESIYFYYSGHGTPSWDDAEDNTPYLLPVDKDLKYASKDKFFQAENIYQLMFESKASKAFAFMDSCFTGNTDNNSIHKGTAATILRPKNISTAFGSKMAVLVAGTDTQFSTAYEDKGHRMFSYFLIKGLLNKNIRTMGELAEKVRVQVIEQTRGAGNHEQTPTLEGPKSLRL